MMAANDPQDTAIRNALKEQRELKEIIRVSVEKLKRVELFLQMYRGFAAPQDANEKGDGQAITLKAPHGSTQAVFEHVAKEILRERNKPLQSPEFLDEFQKRGHYIGKNPMKMTWNRLWAAKKSGVLINIPGGGYWLADTPIPEDFVIPLGKQRGVGASRPPRHTGSAAGRPQLLADDSIVAAKKAYDAGEKTAVQLALELGVSVQTIYARFRKLAAQRAKGPAKLKSKRKR